MFSDLIRSRYNHDSYGTSSPSSTAKGDHRHVSKGLTVLGAVNGMRPGARACKGGADSKGGVNGFAATAEIDNSCMQSREVWTGTTYALAAGMILEAHARAAASPQACTSNYSSAAPARLSTSIPSFNVTAAAPDDSRQQDQPLPPVLPTPLSKKHQQANLPPSPDHLEPPSASQMLLHMAFTTAQGVHDAGWTSFGYWFATPEAWEASGNFRSLGYMRPLAVWAMQHALTTNIPSSCTTGMNSDDNSDNKGR